jgi:hypothetical protein
MGNWFAESAKNMRNLVMPSRISRALVNCNTEVYFPAERSPRERAIQRNEAAPFSAPPPFPSGGNRQRAAPTLPPAPVAATQRTQRFAEASSASAAPPPIKIVMPVDKTIIERHEPSGSVPSFSSLAQSNMMP